MTPTKKICLITTSELIVRWFLLDQLAALSRQYDVTLIVNTHDVNFLSDMEMQVRVLPLSIARQISPWHDGVALLQLIHILRREQFDLVHSIAPKAGLLAMMAGAICRVPVRIHTFQGEVWVTRTGIMRKLLRFLDWVVAKLTTQSLVVSESERNFLIKEGILPINKSRVLAKGSICGVDIRRFSSTIGMRDANRIVLGIDGSCMVFLYVGRLAVDKGILDLVAAFDQVRQTHPLALLLVVGPDEEGIQIRIRAMRLPSLDAIHFYGFSATPELYIGAADIVCLPSYREGFGMVLLEAAAMGLPVLASHIYGIIDAVVEGETGLLHVPGAVDEIVKKMRRLADDENLRHCLGEQAMIRARRGFAQEYVTGELIKFYESILI